MEKIDLHIHTNVSDGTLSPKELVQYSIDKENAISYSNEKNIVSRLRPKDTLTYKTNDEQLIKSVNDMRIKEEKKRNQQKLKLMKKEIQF